MAALSAVTTDLGAPEPALRALARLWDVQASYLDVERRRRHASREALLAVLSCLGAPLADAAGRRQVEAALAARRAALERRMVEPVVVAWGGRLPSLPLRLPAGASSVSVQVELESGGAEGARVALAGPEVLLSPAESDGLAPTVEVPLRMRLPIGYHRLEVAAGRRRGRCLVVAAPRRVAAVAGRRWGVFAPLYAVHSEGSLGMGDFGDLGDLLAWVASLGGDLVATLPLFATFLDEPFEPSPYSPVSRRFWSEAYVDLDALPELETSAVVRAALHEAQAALAGWRRSPLVDYAKVAAAKRRVLEAGAQAVAGGGRRGEELERYSAAHPELERYATFRAAAEAWRRPWQRWPSAAAEGRLDAGEVPAGARHYHRYAQWVAAGQLDVARKAGAGLMLDLPLGVHPGGYDTWAEREMFLLGASAGAPPDPLNPKGQNWGNPPLHPERVRASGYAYPVACLRELMARSAIIRIDHVMGLHRLFVIPAGGSAADGVYVRSRPEEAYAILALESARSGTAVVGEDLGTVPAYVRREMRTHGVLRSYVAQWGIGERGLEPPPADAIASLNTHDMAPFAAFWQDAGIEDRRRLGVLGDAVAAAESATAARLRERLVASLAELGRLDAEPTQDRVLDAWLAFLADSEAPAVVVALEDLWGETACQNIPGTVAEHPNWRWRMAFSLEAIRSMPEVVGRLATMNDRRRRRV